MHEQLSVSEQLVETARTPTERGSQLFWRGFQDGAIRAGLPSVILGVLLGSFAFIFNTPITTSTLVAAGIGIGTPILVGIVGGVSEMAFPGGRR